MHKTHHSPENFRDWLQNRESFPPRKFCRIRYTVANRRLCYKPKYIARICSLPLHASTDTPTFRVIQFVATEALSRMVLAIPLFFKKGSATPDYIGIYIAACRPFLAALQIYGHAHLSCRIIWLSLMLLGP